MTRNPPEISDAVADGGSTDAPGASTPAFRRSELIAVRLRENFDRLDFAIPALPEEGGVEAVPHRHRRLSEVRKLMMRETGSLPVRKCIYERLPCSTSDGGFERLLIESLEADDKVLAHCRLHWGHHVFFCHERENGAPAACHPDFLVRTGRAVYLVETGMQPPLTHPDVHRKLKSAIAWCERINRLDPPSRSGLPWHYVLLLEEAFRAWRAKGASISGLLFFARLRPLEPTAGEASP